MDHGILRTVRYRILRALLRLACEFGLVALDRDMGRVMPVQLADCRNYVKTLHRMHIHVPELILLPDTALATDRDVSSTKSSIYWNVGIGIECINQLTSARVPSLLPPTNNTSFLQFVRSSSTPDTRFAAHSLLIRGEHDDDRPRDHVQPRARGEHGVQEEHALMSTIGHTFTAMSAGVNILAPITVVAAIDARLDVVERNLGLSSCGGPRHIIGSITKLVKLEDRFKEVHEGPDMDFDKLVASKLAASNTRPPSLPCTASCTTRPSLRALRAAGEGAD
ncbi:hypothetical protein FIBSPDRAFT_964903 [Athelia psychrophila]|uniref:Uncharacterized protein n=1 Tax=Athelia psychrophila TaxID=1759441 RepID=A0A165X7B7_9AGAM|nr:hypothetical protein FIBSPDRAFT_964903 [Fibularhizoctonia sp. CBS 109695]